MTCPLCGEAERTTVSRGPMLAKSDPPELFWHGKRVALSPGKIKIITTLLRFGRVSELVLLMMIGEDAEAKTLTVHLSQIRKAFAMQGVEVKIESIRGWGYEIKI